MENQPSNFQVQTNSKPEIRSGEIARDEFLLSGLDQLKQALLVMAPLLGLLWPEETKAQSVLTYNEENVLQFLYQMALIQVNFYTPSNSPILSNSLNEYAAFQNILAQETSQMNFLGNTITDLGYKTLGGNLSFNFQASFPNYNTNYEVFLIAAQFIEDTVNRAYLGQIQYLAGNKSLINLISGLNSMHSRHSAFIRQVRSLPIGGGYSQTSINNGQSFPLKPWVTWKDLTAEGNSPSTNYTNLLNEAATAYSGEDNTTQGQVPLTNANPIISPDIASESFDQPLSTSASSNLLDSLLSSTTPITFQ